MIRTQFALVPVLLVLASVAVLPAMEVGPPGSGLFVGGWGEAIMRGERRDAAYPNKTPGAPAGQDENLIRTTADALLKVGYNVDEFSLRLDVLAYNRPPFDDGNNVLLEQAFIDWRVSPEVTVRAGRFRSSWIGWEGYHTPELWRVNNSAVWSWNIRDHGQLARRPFLSDGVGVTFAVPDEPLTVSFFLVDDVLGDGPGSRGTDKAYGTSILWSPAGFGRVEFGAVLDPRSMNNGGGTSSTGAAFDLNADIDTFKDQGWFFAAEAQYHKHSHLGPAGPDFGDSVMFLGMANYAFTPELSLTAMVDSVDRGRRLPDNGVIEYAVAVLTRPHKQVRLNAEVFLWDESARNADAYGVAAVLLVELP